MTRRSPGRADVLSLDPRGLSELLKELGEPGYRGHQLFEWLWKKGVRDYEQITVWPQKLRDRMKREFPLNRLQDEQIQVARDQTTKVLLKLADGQRVETVLLPHHYGYSVCVSSQVGCAMGCSFCASGLLGRVRQLTAGEMLDQVRFADQLLTARKARVSRVDLMGIGEPLDNYENVVQFMRLLHEEAGFHLSYRHLTLSTSGLVPAIYKLSEEDIPVTLAVSLHAPNDKLRKTLMPVNRAYPLAKLLPACRHYAEVTGRRVTFEYLMLSGVNDSADLALELVDLLAGFSCHVNLIPWNPVSEHPYQPSPMSHVRDFQKIVQERGISCTIRKELGQEIDAACGQLRHSEEAILSP